MATKKKTTIRHAKPSAKKAAATKTKKPAAHASPAAWPAGWRAPFDGAHALGLPRPGVGATDDDEALLALGYPHILVPLAIEPPADALDAKKFFKRWTSRATHVPASLAPRFEHAFPWMLNPELPDVLAKEPPAMTDERLRQRSPNRFLSASEEIEIFALEAVCGSEKVARFAVDFLETQAGEDWRSGDIDNGGDGLRALYYVLLRVSSGLRAKLRARLEALHAKVARAHAGGEVPRAVGALDAILHGRAGVERGGYRDAEGTLFYDLVLVDDDPAFVAAQVLTQLKTMRPADRARFDVRLATVGGPAVARALRKETARFHSSQKAAIDEQLGHLR